ncbi:MAG: hypothetical protein ACRES3_03705 [Steroidobacteraceae bacterium]
MRHSAHNPLPLGNPLANALVVVVGVLIIAASFVLGVIAFLALSSIFLVLAAIIGIRVWWLQRRLRKSRHGRRGVGGTTGVEIIEGEYHVVSVRRGETDCERE